jgi:hypothetical protein
MNCKAWKLALALFPAAGICADFGLPWGAEYVFAAPGFHTATVLCDGSQRVSALGSISGATKTAAGLSFTAAGNAFPSNTFVITNEFTIGMWVNTAVNSNFSLFGATMGASQSYLELGLGDTSAGGGTNAYFTCRDTNGPSTDYVRITSPNPRDGKDHLLVATMDASRLRIYLDGVQHETSNRSVNTLGLIRITNQPAWGAVHVSASGTFIRRYSGELGVGGYWFRALASNEIQRWWADGIGLEASR